MASSLSHLAPGRLLRWSHPLAAAVATTAVVISLIAVPAYADQELPPDPSPSATATEEPSGSPGASPTEDTATASASSPTSPGPDGEEGEDADEAAESPTAAPSDDPTPETSAATPEVDGPAGEQSAPQADDEAGGPAPAAQRAADATTCGYGTGGQYAATICWLDMTGYNDTQARTPAGQDMTVTLPGGYTLSYNVQTSKVPGPTYVSAPVLPVTTPIEKNPTTGNSRFAFGSEAYRNIPGKPSLYSQGGVTGTKGLDVSLTNIQMTDSTGAPVTSYAFVATDTEDNIASESLRWTSDKNLDLIEALSTSTTKGCQPSGITGLGMTEVNCTGVGGASSLANKSRSILVSADAPTRFALRWITCCQSGIAFGVQTSSIEVVKKVDGRADRTDSFDVSLTSPSGSTLATATTGTANTATTGAVVVIPPNNNAPFTLTDAATTGSGTTMADYSHIWSCTRNGAPDPLLPSGEHTSISVPAGVGDQVVCTVTNRSLSFDGGDAPASYGTTLAGSGPRHSVSDYDAAGHTSSLMLGASVDTESDGVPSAAASGDDTAGTDDEGALTSLFLAPGATAASASVPVVNTTGAAATLYGWVDTNTDGTFQASEAATVTVPNGATSATLSWTGQPPTVDGAQPVVRLRLTTATLADDAGTANLDERSQGAAPDGEVEDSLATVGTVMPDDCTDPYVEDFGVGTGRAAVPVGQTTYVYAASGGVGAEGYALQPSLNIFGAPTGLDHTPGDTNGRMMFVNATRTAGTFFTKTFTGLVDGNGYGLSAWIASVNRSTDVLLPNVKLQVVDPASGAVLATVASGNLPNTAANVQAVWKQFALTFTATGPTARLELVNNASGASDTGNDLALDDILVTPACEHGDAPDSYGTSSVSDGPIHDRGAPHLGATVDYEGDGLPSAAADGDDLAGDDEDGVTFNPALGYPNPTILSGTDAITLQPALNHITVNASASGFASTWVDWNGDGDFADADERVSDAQPVSAGDNDLTFSSTANPPDIRTYVRVRFSTDAGAIHTPTGAAPDGEVEDYRVLVERLIVPAACSPVSEPFYAMTFNSTTEKTGTGGAGTAARYPGVTVVRGRPVDMLIQWTGGSAINANGFFNGGDDAAWNLNGAGSAAEIRWTFVEAGTTTPINVNGVWTVNDMDNGELARIQKSALTGYAVTPGSQVSITEAPTLVHFRGTVSGSGSPQSRFQIWFQNISTFSGIWSGFGNSGFSLDGDGDVPLPQSCDDYGDAPDSYKTLTTSDGPHHHVTLSTLRLGADVEFDGDGQPTPGANGDDTNRTDDEDGVTPPISISTGSPSSVTVNATNTTVADATLVGWIDLDKSGTFDANERSIVTVPAGTNAADFALSFPAATTTQATYARFRLFPGTVVDPLPTGASSAGEVEDYPVTVLVPSLAVTKSSDASASSKPGDTVHYTVTMTNSGTGAFTLANPARMLDDLTGVLDDATYLGDAAATVDGSAVTAPTYTAPQISWSGPLAAGKSVVVTYSVTLEGGGDGRVRNVAFAPPGTNPAPPTPDCAAPGAVPCAPVETLLPKLTITKTANRTQLPAVGQPITYTVTVTNSGPGDYTVAHPATFADDLTAVLDDATLDAGDVSANRGTASFAAPTLSWTGTLPSGESATITYTLTYTGAGDHVLVNNACVPTDEAGDPTDACRTVSVPGSGLRHDKSVDPASGTPVDVDQVLTYTLTFENVGPVAADVSTTDDLSDVLDDAQLVGTPTAGAGLTATVSGTQLEIDGSVPAGETRIVTYQAQVRAWADQGDHLLANVLACEPGEPAGCAPESTSNPVAHLVIDKSSTQTTDSKPGDTVTYTVTAYNDGPGDFTATDPASVVDDLTGVLDDATYGGDATADQGATPTYSAPRITWSGALSSGNTVTITYTVVLEGGGDGVVRNVAWQPGDPGNPGPTPDCATSPRPCDTSSSDLPKLTIRKTSNRSQLPAAGQQITYTVTATNPGPGDYTAAHQATFSDDLSDVLDDATFDAGSITSSTGSASLTGSSLDWNGVLTAGQSATVTYSVTYQETGNLVVDNRACIPVTEAQDPADRCRTVHTPGSGLRHAKSVAPRTGASVVEGQVLTYTLTFENVGPADATVDTHDDLSDVLDDATLVAGSINADTGLAAALNGDRIDITGTVPTAQTLTVTYQVRVKDFADQGDHVVTNALACEPGDPQPCDPTSTTNPVRHQTVTKTSDATVDSKPGDTVSYTVRVVNDGAGDYTADNPATLVDDLTGVLDDATFNGVAHASAGPSPTYAAPRITWAGPLAAGDEVRVTYEVVLTGGGDGVVHNVAWAPADPADPGPTPDCATSPLPCGGDSFDLPKLTVQKSADRIDLPATGEDVTYTVVVTNAGPGDYTDAHPATFTDDLSDVLDDATLGAPDATVGTASVTGPTLGWTGVLAAGESATITYVATYRATGDHVLDNTACVPAQEAPRPEARCDTVSVPGSALVHRKSVSPASGAPVEVGQRLTYTLTFDNTLGAAAAAVDATDDLSDVLDDAAFDDASITAGAGLTAVRTGNSLAVTGSVPAGAIRTVTYEVTVRPFADQGDHVLTNALACESGEPDPCAPETVSNPVRHVVLTKVKTSPADPDTGDQVVYTLTVHNDGTGDWTVGDPAEVVDDLTDVVDDATWDDAAVASAGSVSFTSPILTWTGALVHGDTVTITYTVTVTNLGDHELTNTATTTGCALPECAPDPVVTTLPHVVPNKTAAPAAGSSLQPGDTVTYTLGWTNDGTAPGVVDSTDDLSGALDDADLVTEPASSDPAVTATRTGSSLRVTGPIGDGETVTVTYTVRVKPAGQQGDHTMGNVLTQDTPQVTCTTLPCTPAPPPTTEHQVGDLADRKTVDPVSGSKVRAGDRLTYTLHFDSTGTGPVVVDRVDELTGVLDDATLVAGPASSHLGLGASGPANGRIAVTGTLPAGAKATVTYTVQVNKDGDRGDDRLGNYLLAPGQQPPTSCTGSFTGQGDCTSNAVEPSDFNLKLDKRVVSGTKALVGDQVRYRIQVTNKGPAAAPAPIVLRDPLPEGMELVSASGQGWACKVDKSSDKVVCKRTKPLPAGTKATVTVVATATAKATGKSVNVATVSADGDVRVSDNRDVAGVSVSAPPALPSTGFRIPALPGLRVGLGW